jgi:phage recombination protein Bet
MSTQLSTQTKGPSALSVMAAKINVDPAKLLQTLKSTVFKGASDDELLALVVVANTYQLNPLLKELYAFPAKGGGIVPVVSIDGWVSMVNNHPQMDGMEFDEHYSEAGRLEAITCKLWRKDRNRPIMVTEHLSECKRNTEPWKMEHRMLRHKALMQCARYAFGFSGITDEDEAADTPGLRDVTPAKGRNVGEVIDPFKKPEPEPRVVADDLQPDIQPDLASMPDAAWGDETADAQPETLL